ncbi:MAG TPA: asparaginase [Pyrinomonadaceae bacterium]|nr:asparaginase [Pyrinomonadaceae bacterium]HMP65336.1 asparaginase [Pyrinomonadaceae bacterium]
MASKVLAKVVRGGVVESVHRGHLVVINGDKTVASAGNPNTVTFFRSAAKPLQAIPFITSGAADAFGFSDEEIALACASHSGESRHVRIAQLMLERVGLSEIHLRCGAHLPFYDKEAERMQREGEFPTQLHNNCSGKHAAMLATAKYIGSEIAEYEISENPIQKEILKVISRFTQIPESKIGTATDGCAAPNFALPLASMAKSFMNLISPPDDLDQRTKEACGRIVSAMRAFPELIGGSERLDTIMMQAAEGQIISKVGAEGVWLCGVLPNETYPDGLAIALKIEDGDDRRARPVVAAALLEHLGILPEDALPELSPMPVKNRRGDVVGKVVSVIDLAA